MHRKITSIADVQTKILSHILLFAFMIKIIILKMH